LGFWWRSRYRFIIVLTVDSYTITGNSPTTYKAQVTIGEGKEGGLEAGSYTLVGGELKKEED
jgi:hypothetical protein